MGKYDKLNMCAATTSCNLANIFNTLDENLTEGVVYEGDSLTSEQINTLNNMCKGYSDLQFGTLLNTIIEASKERSSLEDLTEAQKSALQNLGCPVATEYNLAEVIENFITQINGESVSSDATLKSLSVEGQTIEPTFSSEIVTYSLSVDNSVANVNILAEATDANATIQGNGNVALEEGANVCKVTVTAEDKTTTKEYTINITRAQAI